MTSVPGQRFSQIVAALTAACALVVTGLLVKRELLGTPALVATGGTPSPIEHWEQYAVTEHRKGSNTAKVTILEFADFECPACRDFATRSLKGVLANYGDRVALVFRHWPLSYHRFAYPAARAAECAGAQGRFFEIHDLLYQGQDSLGLKSFHDFAAAAAVTDLVAFDRCIAATDAVMAIERDILAAKDVKGTGTPTIIINGLRYNAVPDSTAFDQIVRKALEAPVVQ